MYFDEFETPLGLMTIAGDDEGLRYASWSQDTTGWQRDRSKTRDAREQLRAYFAGKLTQFDLPLAPQGTAFQREVWRALVEQLPFGATTSYGQLARQLGRPKSARAVGHANGKNPICVIIPCHRVIGQNGKLTGYAFGLERKRALLDIEGGGAAL